MTKNPMTARFQLFSSFSHGLVARATIALLLLLTTKAFAQPVPTLTSISPDVLQRGQSTHLTITGDNLGAASQMLLIGPPGLSATLQPTPPTTKPTKTLTIDIAATPDAPRGLREIRLIPPNG